MQVMKENDYKLFERLVSLTQIELHKTMQVYLKKKYKKIIVTKDYIVAIGDIPIALVAHMDTVFKFPVENLYYDQRKGVLWSPDGLGADDRAGVFSIIKIIQSGLRPSIILTTDEEIGGVGASVLGLEECPIPNLKYLIELDRQGSNDCVFYCCDNPAFTQYVCKFGFIERIGSFSDISYLMSDWQVCGVNLSVGYIDEHSVSETLHIGALYSTIQKVQNMLMEKNIPDFEYKENEQDWFSKWYNNTTIDYDIPPTDSPTVCCKCKQKFEEYELFPVKGIDGTTKYYCPDCLVDNVDWCNVCGEPYEISDPTRQNLCNDCANLIKPKVEVEV